MVTGIRPRLHQDVFTAYPLTRPTMSLEMDPDLAKRLRGSQDALQGPSEVVPTTTLRTFLIIKGRF